ncbi:MAG: hypothetical protein DMD39_06555 [Gemmatimonadetes bacterium]|nr:MAG: hypothetical protein DMD39_06555 [Gemmatimonadota bacterium]
MRNSFLAFASALVFSAPLGAQSTRTPTADEIIARFIKTVGGAEKIQSIRTLRRVGKFTGDDGFEAVVIEESSRPNKVREEFSIQGMTGVNAYDGANGWKIDPFGGKKDPESLNEEEMRSIGLRRAAHQLPAEGQQGRARRHGPDRGNRRLQAQSDAQERRHALLLYGHRFLRTD